MANKNERIRAMSVQELMVLCLL